MAYVGMAVDVLRTVPMAVWVAVGCGLFAVAALAFALCEYERAEQCRRVAADARNRARLWQAVAEGRARTAVSKQTVVAPQFHAPRAAP